MNRDIILSFWIFLSIFSRCYGNSDNYNIRNNLFTIPETTSSLNGFVCSGSFTVKEDLYTDSVSRCAFYCSEQWECIGFFYHSDSTKCAMCNYLFQPAGTSSLQTLSGSKYYERSDCFGWIGLLGTKKLRIFFQKVNQSEAQSICESDSGTLVKISEAGQMVRLSDLLISCPSYQGNDYWTDGVMDPTTGTYMFLDGTALVMDINDFWEPDAPDDGNECTRLRYNSAMDKFRWNDYRCEVTFRFICEY